MRHPKARCYTAPLSPLLHGTLTKSIVTQHPKARWYTTLLQSQLLHVNIFHKFSKHFTKSLNTILTTFTKGPILFCQHFIKNPKLLGKQLFYQSPKLFFGKKKYFDILNSLTRGKHKLLMTYYPYFKIIYSTKFMGTMLIFSIRNSNYKSPCILQTHGKTIHFAGMNKPKKANNKAKPRQHSLCALSQQQKLTWVTKMVRAATSQVSAQLDRQLGLTTITFSLSNKFRGTYVKLSLNPFLVSRFS